MSDARDPQQADVPESPIAAQLRRRAVALRYDKDRDAAPRVVATGKGFIAERIVELAEAEGISVFQDPDLVTMLAALDLHAEIPPQLYKVVAEVLAFVYRMNQRALPGLRG